MRRLTIGLLLTVWCSGCASAVDEPYFSCDDDGDCPSGKKCVTIELSDKVCKPIGCERDSDCDSGEYCDGNTQQCREHCEGDWDCNLEEYCHELTQECREEETDD